MPRIHPALTSSDSTDWCTPPEVIERVRLLIGPGERLVDPCASTVDARRFADESHCELGVEFLASCELGRSRVLYVNPPWARRSPIEPWACALIEAHAVGRAKEAVLLCPAKVERGWWQTCLQECSRCCLWEGRIKFLRPDGTRGAQAPFPTSIFYFGERGLLFSEAFEDAGVVIPGGRGIVEARDAVLRALHAANDLLIEGVVRCSA